MKKLIIGLVAGIMIGSMGTALAAESVQAVFAKFNVVVDGEQKQLKTDPAVINDRSYLPVADVAGLLGYDVQYVAESRTIKLDKKSVKDVDDVATQNDIQSKINIQKFNIGEEFELNNVTLKLNSVSHSSLVPYSPGGSAGFVASEGERFAIIDFDVLTSDEPTNRFTWSANDFFSNITVDGKTLHTGSSTGESMRIELGVRKTVQVFISIPENSQVTSVQFKDPSDYFNFGLVEL